MFARRIRSQVVAGVVLGAIAAASLVARAADDNSTLALVLENDVFFEADHDYTNGVQLSWVTKGGIQTVEDIAAFLVPSFPVAGGCAGVTCDLRANYALGQNMYTPRDISLTNPPLNDRPYAGWLYASIGLVAATKFDKTLTRFDRFQLQAGIVGPGALGEQTQTEVHEIIDSQIPNGWDTQLKDEPGFVLTYERSWRYRDDDLPLGLEFDFTPHLGGALGNVSIYANGGATFALGWELGEYAGPPRIEPSTPGSTYFEPADGVSFYLFASADGRVVGRNIFLDGNTWKDSRHVEKEVLVIDAQIGWAVAYDRARLAFSHVFRSREFKSQSDPDEYGSVSLTVAF
jgi:hypothetical protein